MKVLVKPCRHFKILVLPCMKRKFEKRLRQGKLCKKVVYIPVYCGNMMKNFVNPCTTQEFEKCVYFDPSSFTHLYHLCYLCPLGLPRSLDFQSFGPSVFFLARLGLQFSLFQSHLFTSQVIQLIPYTTHIFVCHPVTAISISNMI